ITSQSEGAITLTQPREKFSYLLFLFLLIIWPLAILYLVYFNTRSIKSVCVRVTSQGEIEASGYTLKMVERERRRERLFMYIGISFIVLMVIAVIALLTVRH